MPAETNTSEQNRIPNSNTTPVDAATVTVKFYPETWETHHGDDRAVPAGTPVTFTVPIAAVTKNGKLLNETTYEMDELKDHPNAPETVREWDGPFEIKYDEINGDTHPTRIGWIETATASVTFHPQIPIRGGSHLTTIEDTWTYTIPAEDALNADNNGVRETDSEASDQLAHHSNAPEIVQRWTELTDWYFYISIDEFHTGTGPLSPEEFINALSTGGDTNE